MMSRIISSTLLTIVLSISVQAQTARRTANGIPRMANGKPDLSGVWQPGSTIPGTWEEANSGFGLGGTGTNPNAPRLKSSSEPLPGEAAPYQPWAAEKLLQYYNRRGIDDPTAHCLLPGVTRAATQGLFPMKIMQTPQEVVMLYEYFYMFRIIPLAAKHQENIAPTYMGDSIAHWEGDTLVVDSIGFNDQTWLQGTGTFHSEDLHITERYTRVGKDRIDYEAKLEDPKVFTKPWVIHSSMMLREGTRLQENVCAENNTEPARFEKLEKDGVPFQRQ
jgi:hypothetical protein